LTPTRSARRTRTLRRATRAGSRRSARQAALRLAHMSGRTQRRWRRASSSVSACGLLHLNCGAWRRPISKPWNGKEPIGETDTSSCPGLRRFPCPRWRQRRTRVKASWRQWRTASIAGHGRRRPSALTKSRGRPTSTPPPCAAPVANSSVSTAATSNSRQPTSTGSGPATARCVAPRSALRSSAHRRAPDR
jgi:hypothetical protein